MNKIIISLVFLVAHAAAMDNFDIRPIKAFCCVKVADVVSQPLRESVKDMDELRAAYNQLPISWGPNAKDLAACPRIYQILFQEPVELIATRSGQAHVQIPHVKVLTKDGLLESLHGWVMRDAVQVIEEEMKEYLAHYYFADNKLTLSRAANDPDSSIPYSAGTQFTIIKESNKFSYYIAHAFNAREKTFKTIVLSKDEAIKDTPRIDERKRALFCSLISEWGSRKNNNALALVWGGASIINSDPSFHASTRTIDGQTLDTWDKNKKVDQETYFGPDASGAILRAAQSAGINQYQWRNSKTAASQLEKIENPKTVLNGDLLWIEGGLFVINDLKNNIISTAQSYSSGHGIFGSFALSEVFKDIGTYEQLFDAIKNGRELMLLTKDGSSSTRTAKSYKLLRLL